ncbi:MAG TPA: ATP-binding protein, partial [Ktedonobacteraceae bacterium]|nr:ATP-binding protein [Ktedonobacteraceae bacterium]
MDEWTDDDDLIERDEDLRDIDRFLQGEDFWVLFVTGVGGIGKSTLLQKIKKRYDGGVHAVFILNFTKGDLRNDRFKVLERISNATSIYCDQIAVQYFKNALLETRKAWLESPNVNVNQSIEATESKIQNVHMEVAARSSRESFNEHALGIVTIALGEQLRTFKHSSLLILLDECEWLRESVDLKWVLEIIDDIRQNFEDYRLPIRCRAIGASHVRPWLGFTVTKERRLNAFQRMCVVQYLRMRNVGDQHFQNIYEFTQGHPQCLAMIGDIYQDPNAGIITRPVLGPIELVPARPGQIMNDETFQQCLHDQGFYKRAWDELIMPKILQPLPELYKKAILAAAAAEYFSADILHKVLNITQPSNNFLYSKFTSLPCVIKSVASADCHQIDPLLRDIIRVHQNGENSAEWNRYRQRFNAYCRSRERQRPPRLSWRHKIVDWLRKKV